MKLKNSILILTIVFMLFLFCQIFIDTGLANNNGAELSFEKEPTYELINTIHRGGDPIGWTYKIDVYIKNSGNSRSEYTEINLTDEEGFNLLKYSYFEPGETKNISFIWSTLSDIDQKITVSYLPENKNAVSNVYNKDSMDFFIIIEDKDEIPAASTPGFLIYILLFAVFIIIYVKKKEKI